MSDPTRIPERQLDLGAASYFRVVPETPPGNQVEVTPGFLYSGAFAELDAFTGGNQTTAAFAPVSPAQQRYDLVYLSALGVATVLAGTAVAFGSPVFEGAPGFTLGPPMPDSAVPLAYVLVIETGAVTVDTADITALGGQHQVTRDLQGYRVDKGLFGSAPAGADDVFTALFAAETPSGGSVPGVVTAPPDNYMDVLDQVQDEIKHSTGAKMFVRLTEAAGIWTGTYRYIDAAGVEQGMDPSADTAGPAPTDLRLIGTRKIFSRNDPARPMFDDAASRVSDQLVGTIPDGSESVKGKVEFVADLGTASLEAVQGSDTRLASPIQGKDSGGSQVGGRYDNLQENGGIILTDLGGGDLGISTTAGALVQQKYTETTSVVSAAGTTPADTSIPQVGEGTQIMVSPSITPTSLSNFIEIIVYLWGAPSNTNTTPIVHVHRDSVANAVAAMRGHTGGTSGAPPLVLRRRLAISNLNARTYQVRLGVDANTWHVNGDSAGVALFGSSGQSNITVREVLP